MAADIFSRDNSILQTIAQLIGGEEYGEHFYTDLVVAINTALSVLTQVGVGPEEGFAITGEEDTWRDFLGDDTRLNMAITYVQTKVRMIFDPPQSNVLKEAMTELINEMEWRAYIAADPASYPSESDGT